MRRARGFSLIEMLMTLALLGLLIGLGLGSLRPSDGRGRVRLGAEQLAAIAKAASSRARAQAMPVAVGIPGGASAGCYVLEGSSQANLVRVHSWTVEFPNLAASGASYAGPTWAPISGNALNLPQPFDLDAWAGSWKNDALYVFLPSGQCLSNRSAANGQYRLTVAPAFSVSGTPPALTKVYRPYTVSISPAGSVETQPGLPGGQAGLAVESSFAGNPLTALPQLASASNSPPDVADPYYTLSPAAVDATGAALGIRPGALVTLEVFCKDLDGDALFARWTSTGSGQLGQFTDPGRVPMRWDPTRACWVGRCGWRAPQGTESVTLDCVIDDNRGGQINLSSAIAAAPPPSQPLSPLAINVATKPRLGFTTNYPGGFAQGQVWACDLNGGEEIKLVPGDAMGEVWFSNELEWNPASQSLIWCRQNGYGLAPLNGKKPTTYYTGAQPQRGLSSDPDGRAVYVLEQNYSANNFLIQRLTSKPDGTAKVTLMQSFGSFSGSGPYLDCVYVSPDEKFAIAFDEYSSWKALVFAQGANPYVMQSLPFTAGRASVCQDGVKWVQVVGNQVVVTPLNYDAGTHSVQSGAVVTYTVPGLSGMHWDLSLSRTGRYLVDRNMRVVDLKDLKTWKVTPKKAPSTIHVVRVLE